MLCRREDTEAGPILPEFDLLGWLKAEIVWLFAYIAWQSISGAGAGRASLGVAFLPVAGVTVGLTMVVHLRRMYRPR